MWVAAITPLNFSGNFILKHRHCRHQSHQFGFRVRCSDSQSSNPRGFGTQDDSNVKKRKDQIQKGTLLQQSNSISKELPGQAPGVTSRLDKVYIQNPSDLQFEKKLEAVKRSAVEKKKVKQEKEVGPIDYDAPIESEKRTIGLGTKIGVGIAVVVFGLLFALGDFLPSGSTSSSEDSRAVSRKLSKEETAVLQSRLQQYQSTLSSSPKDTIALEGAAVTLAELGDFAQAATYLEDLTKERPSDPDVFRLLGEVKYELKDYEGSVSAYRSSDKVSKTVDFEVLRGLTNALLAAKKPDEAVQMLLETRERLNKEQLSERTDTANGDQTVDPVQVELLLGKAYSDWGHIGDAVSVYDQLISTYPNDFRAYLAKGIILKQNGNVGDAERMFIQARFFAPEKAKLLVDQYAKS